MKSRLLFSFCFLSCAAHSQSSFLTFYAGPEISFPIKQYYPLSFPGNEVGSSYKSQAVVGIVSDLNYFHQTKYGLGIQTGMSFKRLQYTFYYSVDSTPLVPPVHDNAANPYQRPYDKKYQLYEAGPNISFNYKIKLSGKVDLLPSAGIILYLPFTEKHSTHYYRVDTTGVTDPGPLYDESSWSVSDLIDDERHNLTVSIGTCLLYKYTKKISFNAYPTFNMRWSRRSMEDTFTSYAIRVGMNYKISKK